jgi:N-acetylmuramoyl-L-alanine amidase
MSPQPTGTSTAPAPARTIDLIVVHCSATPSGRPLGTGLGSRRRTAALIIDGWHMQRGFARRPANVAAFKPDLPHIGYHYVLDLNGLVQLGRGLDEVGAHVAGHNAHSVGICLVGGLERTARYSESQWLALAVLVKRLKGDWPAARVLGHRDLSPDADGDGIVTPREWLKTCPGFDVARWWAPVESGAAPDPLIPAGQVLA